MLPFAFWGLFLCFGVIVVFYLIWMFATEARERRGDGPAPIPDSEELS